MLSRTFPPLPSFQYCAVMLLYCAVLLMYVTQTVRSAQTPPGLKIGAFNIQTFGKAKMSNSEVADRIRQIVERYDVLLIQEVRDQSLDSVRQLLSMLTLPFDFVASDPIGRTTYKEQYVFFFRTDRVLLLDTDQYQDDGDVFEREPYTAHIAPMSSPSEKLALIALHSKPEDATSEIGHLQSVIASVQGRFGLETEPVVLGDLNADCSYANYSARVAAGDYLTTNSTWTWLIGEDIDTTVRSSTNCAYDRLIVRSRVASLVIGSSVMAFNFGSWLGLNEQAILAVSDHYPVEMDLNL